MSEIESRNNRFKRLAKQRGERLLKDLQLLGNLSNRNNYEYSENEIRKLFGAIEEELRANKARFTVQKNRKINF
jgi:hypothetical protein